MPVTRLCDAAAIHHLILNLADQIAEDRLSADAASPVHLVGIHSRGVPLAERLATVLRQKHGQTVVVGALDITLYRDDLDHSARWPVLNGTNIHFPVEGAEIILVDDVLFTGRTIRAALNSLCDLGRPRRIRLAVAVSRDHRELPLHADYVGIPVRTRRDQRIQVHLKPVDPEDEILRIDSDEV